MNTNFDQFRAYVNSRPMGITVLGLAHVLIGAFHVCSGLITAPIQVLTICCNPLGIVDTTKGIIGGILFLIVGSALMSGQSWARWLAIIASAINFLNLLRGGLNSSGEFIAIIISVFMMVYMFTPGVQAYFSRRS